MNRNTYNLLFEPVGQLYFDLLDYALKECKYFLLVTDPGEKQLYSIGRRVLNDLSPFLYKLEMKSEWPGTTLIGGKVSVYLYQFVKDSAEILKMFANGLYQWQRPQLPDDLCLLRSDESPWLVSIAHECDGFFILTEEEMLQLLKTIPAFSSSLELNDELRDS